MNVQELQDAIKESGLPVSEVVKYIKHGPDMKDILEYIVENGWNAGVTDDARFYLAKLEEA